MSKRVYGLDWSDDTPQLMIELAMVRRRGRTDRGEGRGTFYHAKSAFDLMWKGDDHHRWTDQILQSFCDNEITVLMGAADTGKTFCAAKWILMDYWSSPANTLWLVSSTELIGAELRIWGKIKDLFNRAKAIHPYLPGNVLEAKHTITTEHISEDGSTARSLLRGIIFIACRQGGRWVGMGNHVGIKPTKDGRLRHCGDECFPAGTLVDTPLGPKPIENIRPGDDVFSAAGVDRVAGISRRTAHALVVVKTVDGRRIVCTPDHSFFTNEGWKRACELNRESFIVATHEAVRILQQAIPTKRKEDAFLQSLLRFETNPQPAGDKGEVGAVATSSPGMEAACNSGKRQPASWAPGPDGQENLRLSQGQRLQAEDSRWQRHRPDEGGNQIDGNGAGSVMECSDQNGKMERERVSSCLQSRYCDPCNKIGYRGGRRVTLSIRATSAGPQKGGFFKGAWVDCIEVFQPTNFGRSPCSWCGGGYRVYNLQVEKHPSYSVIGLLVHNCSFMQRSFLDAYSNWYGKDNFQGILNGNPIELDDPLCTAAEPVEGWANWKDTGKTQEWQSRWYGAHVIALDGRDSPNFDFPGRTRYPYLIGKKKIEAVQKFEGDSDLFYNQCIGKPRPGAERKKVITRLLCEQGKAFDKVVWAGSETVHIVANDAAYSGVGGDRCVLIHCEFGRDVDGKNIFCAHQPVIVPVNTSLRELPEDQIAKFARRYCEGLGVPPENFFFDARATLAVAYARLWSPNVNAVDFGGAPTDRPVSQDEYVWEGDNTARRLKKASEHYSKFVTELWYSVRYAILGQQVRELPIEVAEELWKREWEFTKGNRIEVESKVEMKKRTKFSPDLADSLVTALEGARRRGFMLQNMKENQPTGRSAEDWLAIEVRKHREKLKRTELSYK